MKGKSLMDISSNDLLYKPESVVSTRDLPSLGKAERGEVSYGYCF